ncbi:hypothetical protein [Croceibacterium aestuarii]|uniref:hypothetical protein n=1 Tax=Croceibacterium aestuarii TaxID=3064139 RepID=UPI00272E26BE|nr:hypothetical protein [Croceibacterium sp. D39]
MSAQYLRGQHAELGDLFAAWEPCSHHVEPGVRNSRFAARLAPFRTREEAEQALIAEGAVIEASDG